ncbi:MAG: hypothetical protein ACRCSW_20060 [Tabrizicola sp.]
MRSLSFVAVLTVALCPVVGLAETNPSAAPLVDTLQAAVADPAQKDALCAYLVAWEAVGVAMAGGDMAELGQAQGNQKMAALAVSEEFATAVETLPFADQMAFLEWSVSLNALCS